MAIVAAILAFPFMREGRVVNSMTSSGYSSRVEGSSWVTHARSADGSIWVDVTLDENQLAALRLLSANSAGNIILTLIQNDFGVAIYASGIAGHLYETAVDASMFAPGRIRLMLTFEQAEDVEIIIRW